MLLIAFYVLDMFLIKLICECAVYRIIRLDNLFVYNVYLLIKCF